MQTEHTVLPTVIAVLSEAPNKVLSTGELRERVKERLKLTPKDHEPLLNRSDKRIDQVIRNIKCHRNTPGNPFYEGVLVSIPGGFSLNGELRA